MLRAARRAAHLGTRILAIGLLLATGLGTSLEAHAQNSYVNFETVAARPLALSPDGSRLFATNTPDNRLEIFDVTPGGLLLRASLPVGLEPVAVNARTNGEVWVVNHLSDSVSVVDVSSMPPRIVRTLLVGDEPWDVVFGGTADPNGAFPSGFITAARRGQHVRFNQKSELRTTSIGRADLWVFDATNLGSDFGGTPQATLQLFGDKPRALTVSADGSRVTAAVFHSGNQTTAINELAVCDGFGGLSSTFCVIGFGSSANPLVAPGGLPDPDQDAFGNNAPEVGLIVKLDPNGIWRDELARNWSDAVPFTLPDQDVFEIDAVTLSATPTQVFSGVGTVLFAMATHPSGRVYVANTDARNEVRFEGPGLASTTVRGHLHEARVTVLGGTPTVQPRHLNKHIDYSLVPVPAGVKDDSLATPTGLVFNGDGSKLYVAAFGSGKLGVFNTADLDSDTFVPSSASHITLSGGGPSAMVHDAASNRLYVLTRFDNAIKTIDTTADTEIATTSLYNPEPAVVTDGRRFLYDALLTSSNGETSCSSCHVFGNLDALGWDLGNPDDEEKDNDNPFAPLVGTGNPVFHPMKGPMTTQTLRGLDHAGPMHWRGDRTGATAGNPNGAFDEQAAFEAFNVAFGGLVGRDEGELDPNDMTAFADFALTITMPPNPYRNLDNSLTTNEFLGQNIFMTQALDAGALSCNHCHVHDLSQSFFGTGGEMSIEGETQEFKIPHLRNMYDKLGMFGTTIGSRQPGELGPQIRGFGYLHDGSVGSVGDFLSSPVFAFANDTDRQNVVDFMFVFPSNLSPIVGQNTTRFLNGPNAIDLRIGEMRTRAMASFNTLDFPSARECELIVTGTIAGTPTSWMMDGSDPNGLYTDGLGNTITDPALRALADVPGQELTFHCVYPTGGQRIGFDRDEDGNHDIEQCGDTNGDGLVTKDDATFARLEHAAVGAMPFPAKCNVVGTPGGALTDCDARDVAVITRVAAGRATPGALQICGPAL